MRTVSLDFVDTYGQQVAFVFAKDCSILRYLNVSIHSPNIIFAII